MSTNPVLRSTFGVILIIPLLTNFAGSIYALPQRTVISDEVRTRIELSYPELRGNTNWLDQTILDDPGDFVEELVRFFQMGDNEIDLRENETDIVLIVGASGVGKSTLGYVIAGNEENQLSVICNENTGVCKIVDENGHIGNETIVSQTLLPNLILEQNLSPHTAFYDCPGFFDNRNDTVEIANSYFINKVARHAKRLKIFIVALFEHFSDSNRSTILNLLEQIVSLFPNVGNYPESVLLIANRMTDFRLSDTVKYNRMKEFLVEKVKSVIESGEVLFPVEGAKMATSLIDSLVGTHQNNSGMWYFPEPEELKSGPIEDFPEMMAAKEYIRDLIWNKTAYYLNMTDGDFGFPLSGNAEAKLLTAAVGLNSQIQNLLNDVFTSTRENVLLIYEAVISGDTSQFDAFLQISANLYRANYPPFSEFQDTKTFASKIIEITKTYSQPSDGITLIQIEASVDYLTRVNMIRDYTNLTTPDQWIAPFEAAKLELKGMLINLDNDLNAQIQQSMDAVLTSTRDQLLAGYEKIVSDDTTKFTDFVEKSSNVSTVDYPLYSEFENSITRFTLKVLELTKSFSDPSDESNLDKIESTAEYLFHIIEILGTSNVTIPDRWVAQFPSIKRDVNGWVTSIAINLDGKLQTIATQAATEITEYIGLMIDKINIGNPTGTTDLQRILPPLLAASFPKINDTAISGDISTFTNQLLTQIRTFSDGQAENFLNEISEKGHLLEQLQSIKDVFQNINTENWVEPFSSILTKITNRLSEGLSVSTLEATNATIHQVALSLFGNIRKQINTAESIEDRKTNAGITGNHLTDIEADINEKLLPGTNTSFSTLVQFYIQTFKEIDPQLSVGDLADLTSLLNIITLLESVEKLDYQVGYQWTKPITELKAAVQNELNFLEFLHALYQGLSTSAVHVNKKGDLHAWRQIFGNKPTTPTNLDGLFQRLLEAEVILNSNETIEAVKRHLAAYPEGFETLNLILEYTIGSQLTPASCPRIYNTTLTFDLTNYLTMSYVVACLDGVSPLPSHIVLLSQAKFFLDSPLEITKYTNSSITIFQMSMDNEIHNVQVNLNGRSGPPPNPIKLPGTGSVIGARGSPGQAGSNYVSIYSRQTGNLDIQACGGPGGQGQGGSDGADGGDGQQKFRDTNGVIPETQCTVKNPFNVRDIRIKIFPNSCNEQYPSDDYCRGTTFWITLYGKALPGSLGGTGGAGGAGGRGGFIYTMEVTSASNPTIREGWTGNIGSQGAPGNQGNTGPKGRDNAYGIHVENINMESFCYIYARDEGVRNFTDMPLNVTGSKMSNVRVNQIAPSEINPRAEQCSSSPIQAANIDNLKGYITQFTSFARLSLNAFNYERLNKMITDVAANPNLK